MPGGYSDIERSKHRDSNREPPLRFPKQVKAEFSLVNCEDVRDHSSDVGG